MGKQATSLEKAIAEYFKTGIPVETYLENNKESWWTGEDDSWMDEWVEIAILPGNAHSDLDAMWIQSIDNRRVGATLYPDENLKRFFTIMNVHPRDVLQSTHFEFTPASPDDKSLDVGYRTWINKKNSEIVSKYFDLLNNFEVDPNKPALCDTRTATDIIDNASYGGWPLIAGYARVRDIMSLNFDQDIVLDGHFQVGIWNNVNGSGHCESASKGPFKMKLERGDFIGLATRGWTPDHSCGFVRKYYKFSLSNAKASVPNTEIELECN